MNYARLVRIFLLATLPLISGPSGTCSSEVPSPQEGVINVGVLPHSSAIPIIIAQQQGLFEKRGIQVALKVLEPAQHMPALLRGDVQVLSMSSFPVIFATAQQNPGKLFAYMTGGEALDGEPLYAVIVLRHHPATSLKDLIGKTIGSVSQFTTINLRNVLANIGDTKGRTVVREFSNIKTLFDAMQKGKIDAAILDQPNLSSNEISDKFKIIEINLRARYMGESQQTDRIYWSGAGIARRDWVLSNIVTFESYLAALDEALRLTRKENLLSKETFIKYFQFKGFDPNRLGMDVYPNARFSPSKEYIQKMTHEFVEIGILSSAVDDSALFYQ